MNKEQIVRNILIKYTNILDHDIDLDNFIKAIVYSNNVAKYLQISATKLSNLNKAIFPNKPNKGKLRNYILSLDNYKVCNSCDQYLKIDNFRMNNSNKLPANFTPLA